MDVKKLAFLLINFTLLMGCEKSSRLSSVFVPTPVPGACDPNTHYQCLNGTTPIHTREEDSLYKWSCLGLNGGEDIHTCTRGLPVNGQCDETIHYQCLNGTTPANTRQEGDFYKWSCLGLNSGSDIHTCRQGLSIPGQCDGTNHYQCLNGTTPANTRQEGGFYKWSCLGLHGGSDIHTCSLGLPVDGQCDPNTHYQCLNGTVSTNNREEGGFYKWSCLGLNSGSDIHTCSQALPVDGQCDPNTHYQCLNGTTPANTREENGFYKWSCLGLNNGADIHTCSKAVALIQQDSFEVTQTSLQMNVDILMIIDNSGSMKRYQEKLGSRFGDLFSSLSGVNWQMAFINTDRHGSDDGDDGVFYNLEDSSGEFQDNGSKIQILRSSRTNAQDLFLNTINRDESGSNNEYPLTNFIRAIGLSQNQAFFRSDAALATIILTNEGSDTKTPSDVITAVENQFGSEKRFFAYAIICELTKPCPIVSDDPDSYTNRIKALATQTGGIVGEINAEDYSSILQSISQSLGNNLTLIEVPLRYQNVIPGSISLTFIPSSNEVGWNFDEPSNKIVFDRHPPENTRIQISYSYQVQ